MSGVIRRRKHGREHVSIGLLLEPLESRLMLAADLTGAIASLKFGTVANNAVAVVVGSAAKPIKGSVKVEIANADAAPLARTVAVTVRVVLRATGKSDILVGQSTKPVKIGGLSSASGPKSATVKLQTPATTAAAGTYQLVAIVDHGNVLTESNENNNTATAAPAYNLAAAFEDLNVTGGSESYPDNAVAGTSGEAVVTLTNSGNVPASGSVDLRVFAVRQGQPDQPLGSLLDQRINLKPGAASKPFKIALRLPTTLTDDAAYSLVVRVTAADISGDVANNNSRTLGSVTVDVPTMAYPAVGNLIQFAQERSQQGDGAGGAINKAGRFVDGNNRGGTYTLLGVSNGGFQQAALSMTYDDPNNVPPLIQVSFTFNSGQAFQTLNNRTMTFSLTPAGQDGVLLPGGTIHYQIN